MKYTFNPIKEIELSCKKQLNSCSNQNQSIFKEVFGYEKFP